MAFLKRMMCCGSPSKETKEAELESEVMALRAKLAAAEADKQQIAEELSDATAKQSILAQKIVKVEAEYDDFCKLAAMPHSGRRPLSRTVSARRPFTPLTQVLDGV
jgi:hypothetical protein